ncbi:MAG TPA: hypothetical protein DEV93_03005 [Chloroflexi bacterium]|jgi:hypothetical protein|nr:hypothetical protein [Chloroflexota bacterium]
MSTKGRRAAKKSSAPIADQRPAKAKKALKPTLVDAVIANPAPVNAAINGLVADIKKASKKATAAKPIAEPVKAVVPAGQKFCGRHDTSHSVEEFANDRSSKDGKYSICIDQLIGDFFNGVALPGSRPKVKAETAAQALAKIKAQEERNQELYVDGDRDKATYAAEKARLVALAAAYVEQETAMPEKAELLTLGAMWRDGDVSQRWKVLSSLFEHIEMRDRKIVGFKPRADRVGRVRRLINTAVDYAIGFDEEADAAMADDPGALNISGSGEGGIRTVDWQYRVRIA